MKAWRQRGNQVKHIADVRAIDPKVADKLKSMGVRLGRLTRMGKVSFLPVPSPLFQRMMARAGLNVPEVVTDTRPLGLNGLPA